MRQAGRSRDLNPGMGERFSVLKKPSRPALRPTQPPL